MIPCRMNNKIILLSSSHAILFLFLFCGYLAGLTPSKDAGDYDFLTGQADMLVDQMNDMEGKMGLTYYGDDEEKKVMTVCLTMMWEKTAIGHSWLTIRTLK